MDRQRVTPPDGYHWEPMPLLFGRAQLAITDGTAHIAYIW